MPDFNDVFASMGLEVTNPEDHLEGTSWLLYGTPGSAKTSVAASAARVPELQDVLYLDFENGTLPVLEWGDTEHTTIINIKSWDDMAKIFDWINNYDDSKTPFPYKTVVIDTIDRMQDFIYAKWEKAGSDGFTAWRQVFDKAMDVVSTLHHDTNLTVIAVTHADRQTLELTGESFIRPSFEGQKSDRKLASVFDFVAYLTWEMLTNKDGDDVLVPVMTTRTVDDVECKRRLNNFPNQLANPSFPRIMELITEATNTEKKEN